MVCTGGSYYGDYGPCHNLTISPDGGYGANPNTSPGPFYVGYLNDELSGWIGGGSQY